MAFFFVWTRQQRKRRRQQKTTASTTITMVLSIWATVNTLGLFLSSSSSSPKLLATAFCTSSSWLTSIGDGLLLSQQSNKQLPQHRSYSFLIQQSPKKRRAASSAMVRRTQAAATSRWMSGSSSSGDDDDAKLDGDAATSEAPAPPGPNDDNDSKFAAFVNRNNIHDQVFSAISKDGGIKVTVVTARNLMNDLMLQHGLSAISAQALGRTVLCSLLLANGIQDEQMVQITIQTPNGPIRGIVAICTGRAEVRGYVGTPMLSNDWELPDAVGRKGGAVLVVKNHPDWPRPYNGITAIQHGDIDRDIGIYLAESEQRSCALAAAVSVHGILCNAAGGYLIEQLPDATDDEKEQVARNLAKLVALDGGDTLPTNLLLSGQTPLDMANVVLDGLDMEPLQQIEPVLKCECTEDRLVRSLRLLPRQEVEDILEKEEQIEARCEFCGKTYRLTPDDVRDRLEHATGDPSRDV